MSCGCQTSSPCAGQPVRTDCEPLPSALDNFINQFFGAIVKTVNPTTGVVTWTLPCDLATGIEGNPRLDNEGIACYLLRLVSQGLEGLQGDKGDKGDEGDQGIPGLDAFSQTTANFDEPAVADTVPVILADTDWVTTNLTVYVTGSGYYKVLGKSALTLNLQLILATGGGGTIAAGALVIPAGAVGAAGLPGVDGDDGAAGENALVFLTGVGVPSVGAGVNGDFYLDTANGDLYKKVAGAWSLLTNIKGPMGDPGADGAIDIRDVWLWT